jgi:FMN-dependent NADH-azoreductase
MTHAKTLLRIDASAHPEGSVTRQLGDEFEARWLAAHAAGQVTRRDLSEPLPLLDAAWVAANLTDPAERSDAQRAALALSDRLIDELRQADAVLVTVPLYNFAVPAAMKAWIDLVCRARETFAYTEQGPRGLLDERPVTVVMASGGVPMGSAVDFASGYLRHIFAFIGLSDVRLVAAERMNIDPDAALASARRQLTALFDDREQAA